MNNNRTFLSIMLTFSTILSFSQTKIIGTVKDENYSSLTSANVILFENNKIIEFTCKELKIPRLIDESFDDFKDRAQIFFDENNSDLRNRIYLIQSLYSANVS